MAKRTRLIPIKRRSKRKKISKGRKYGRKKSSKRKHRRNRYKTKRTRKIKRNQIGGKDYVEVEADFDNPTPREGILLSSTGGYEGVPGRYWVRVGGDVGGEVIGNLCAGSLKYLRSDDGLMGPPAMVLRKEKGELD